MTGKHRGMSNLSWLSVFCISLFLWIFIADTIPLFGWLDDLAIASFIVALALRLVPQEVMSRVKRKVFGAK